jgi:hypothetical protein
MEEPFEVGATVRQRPAEPVEGEVVESQWDGKAKSFRYLVETAEGGRHWFEHAQVERVDGEAQ